MANFSQSSQSAPESRHQTDPQSLDAVPAEGKIPNHPLYDQSVACMLLLREYSTEAKESLAVVRKRIEGWTGTEPKQEDMGEVFGVWMTLFLTPVQHQELLELIKETPLTACTIEEFAEALERGIRGENPIAWTVDSGPRLDAVEYAMNAGHALSKLAADPSLPWEKQRALALDIWYGMIALQDFAESMLRNVRNLLTGQLIEQAKADQKPTDYGIAGLEAFRQSVEFAKTSSHIREVKEVLLPLAKALLALPSPILKQVAYSQLEKNHYMLGQALELYGADYTSMLVALDDWKAFWDSQIPLMSRYFEEFAAERALSQDSGEENSTKRADTAWRCVSNYQGDTVALYPTKRGETVFEDVKGEHLWGMKLIGVPGAVGDRAFALVSEIVANANAEAYRCREAYGQTLVERERKYLPVLSNVLPTMRKAREEQIARMEVEKMAEANRLVHGISDLILRFLPWTLPRPSTPFACNPKVHLDRAITLLEGALAERDNAPGLSCAARMSTQELAIQLDGWHFISVLDSEPELTARAKKLFEDAKVELSRPNKWLQQ